MSYCDGDVQWMRAGRGVIHEEMWDLREADWKHKKIEIFQLWVNLPAKSKSKSPSLHVLKSDAIPVIDCGKGVSIKVICGSLLDASLSSSAIETEESVRESTKIPQNEIAIDGPGSKICESPVSILHVSMREAHSTLDLNTDTDCTMTVYVRRGSVVLDDEGKSEIRSGDCVIYRQSTSNSAQRGTGTVSLTAGAGGLDALLLTGKPLNERVIWQGPLVMADEESFRRSAEGFNRYGQCEEIETNRYQLN
jgi:quercetin 2,3-dioxygenase